MLARRFPAGASAHPSPLRRSRPGRCWCHRDPDRSTAARTVASGADRAPGRSSRARRPCPSRRCASVRRRWPAGRRARARPTGCAPRLRRRISSRGTPTATAGPRRTSPRCTRRDSRLRRQPTRHGGSARPASRLRAPGPRGCRRRWPPRSSPHQPSCHRPQPGARSDRRFPVGRPGPMARDRAVDRSDRRPSEAEFRGPANGLLRRRAWRATAVVRRRARERRRALAGVRPDDGRENRSRR